MKTFRITLICLSLLIVFISCSPEETNNTTNTGSITVAINSTVRGLEPTISLKTSQYKVTLSGPDGIKKELSLNSETSETTTNDLAAGEWTVTADALNSDSIVIGSGSITVEVKANQTAKAIVTVSEIAGDGTLTVSLEGENKNSSAYTLQIYKNEKGTDTLVREQPFALDESNTLKARVTLSNGFYIFKIISSNNSEKCPTPETVRIVKGDSLSVSYSLLETEVGKITIAINNAIIPIPNLNLYLSSSNLHPGDSVTITASGLENERYKYEWYVDKVKIDGETNTLTLDNLAFEGEYEVCCIARSTSSGLVWSASKKFSVSYTGYKPQTLIINGETEFYIVSDVVIPQDIKVGIYIKSTDTLIGNYAPHFLSGASGEVYAKVTNKEGYSVYFEEKYISGKNRTLVYAVIDKPMDTYGTLEINSGINDEFDADYGYYYWQGITDGYVPLPIYNDSRSIKIAPGTYSVNRNSKKWNYNHVSIQTIYDKNTITINDDETTQLTVSIPYGTFILKNSAFKKGESYHVWVRHSNINSASHPFTAEDGQIRIDVSTYYYYDSILVWDNNSEYNNYCIVEGPVSSASTKEVNVDFTAASFKKYGTEIPAGRYKVDTDTNVLLKECVPPSIFWKIKTGNSTVSNFCANLMNVRYGNLTSDADFYYFDLLKSEYSFVITSSSQEDSNGEYTRILFTFDKEIENAGTLVVNYDVPSEITLSDSSRAAVRVLTENKEELNIMVKSAETKTLKVAPGTYTYYGVWSWVTDSYGNSYKAVLDTDSFTVKSGETTTVTVKFEKY